MTPEQRDIALRVASEMRNGSIPNPYIFDEAATIFAERFLAALPKPESVATYGGHNDIRNHGIVFEHCSIPLNTELYAAPPIDADILTIHRILQCVADCPPVEDSDSKVLRDFKSYCHAMNGIVDRMRAEGGAA